MNNKFPSFVRSSEESNFQLQNKKGFTLLELLIVIAILGLLSTFVIAAARYARGYARENKAKHDIAQIYKAIQVLTHDTEEWPGHQAINTVCSGCPNNEMCGPDEGGGNCLNRSLSDGVAGITQNDGASPYANWGGPYMQKIPLDPWDHEYFFDTDYNITIDGDPCDGEAGCLDAVVVGSYGPDGIGNNLYNGDDIIKVIIR